ncbi:MAG: hypothetical protein R3C14_13520 [Caldilineaceae bacterium]
MYLEMNAWREILARIFEGFTAQDNVSPEWLVNPATKRRLKLDKYYPEAGIAIRFIGLTAKGQGRQSDWEVLETEQRDQTRVELCKQHDVQLMLIDPADEPRKQMDNLLQNLTRASRVLAQSDQPMKDKQKWMPALNDARGRATQVRSLFAKNPEQMMATLAESWRDREAGEVAALSTPPQAPRAKSKRAAQLVLVEGQRVHHERFGAGTVTKVTDGGEISILFDGEQERTFLAELVQEKLAVLER